MTIVWLSPILIELLVSFQLLQSICVWRSMFFYSCFYFSSAWKHVLVTGMISLIFWISWVTIRLH